MEAAEKARGDEEKRGEGNGRAGGRRLFLVTGNLKICLRVVEPPEETLLLARACESEREGRGEGARDAETTS